MPAIIRSTGVTMMVNIEGLGGVQEPKSNRPSDTRPSQTHEATDATPSASDAVVISSGAQAAARIAQLIQASGTEPDIRTDRVEAAKAAIARGDYKNPDVIANVAEGVSKLL